MTYDAKTSLRWLLDWLPADAVLTPLLPRSKRPSRRGWLNETRAQLDKLDFRDLFVGEVGIGLVCGAASGGLCLVDIDDETAAAVVTKLLPELQAAPQVIGQRGAKWLVRCKPVPRSCGLWHQGCGVGDLLATGKQGVIAGRHPSHGEPYRWTRVGAPPVIDGDRLLTVLGRPRYTLAKSPVAPGDSTMFAIDRTAEGTAVFRLGSRNDHDTFALDDELVGFLADRFRFVALQDLLTHKETWACGDWRIYVSDGQRERERDHARQRLILQIGDRSWHFTPDELVELGGLARKAVRAPTS